MSQTTPQVEVRVSASDPGDVQCTLVGDQPGTATVRFRLANDTASFPITVQRFLEVVGPPGGYQWTWFGIASPTVAYLSGADNGFEFAYFFKFNLATGAYDAAPLTIESSTGGVIVPNSTGSLAYAIAGGYVVRISTASNSPVDTVVTTPPFSTPGGLYAASLDSRDSMLFVGAGGRVFAVDVHDTMTMKWDVQIAGRAIWIALAPSGDRVYASIQSLPNGSPRHVTAFDAGNGDSLLTFPVDTSVQGIALSPDGTRLYAASEAGAIYSCPVSGNPCDSTGFSSPTSYGDLFIWHDVAVSPDGLSLYLVDDNENGIGILDAHTLQQRGWIGLQQIPGPRFGHSASAGLYVIANGLLTKVGW